MGTMSETEQLTPMEMAGRGMLLAVHAMTQPEKMAVISEHGNRTFAELNANANRLVKALRAKGLKDGDAIALLCKNRPEFIESLNAASRAGWRLTPINWHLTPDEVIYIVDNCEAKAFLCDGDIPASGIAGLTNAKGCDLGIAIGGGAIDGFESYDDLISDQDGENITDPTPGGQMLYTSGTTGSPKGVHRKPEPAADEEGSGAARNPLAALAAAAAESDDAGEAEEANEADEAEDQGPSRSGMFYIETAKFNPATDRSLVTGPLYHAAPLALNMQIPMAMGIGVVLMDKWDAEETLRLVDEYKITHTHMVSTMFQRILGLPEETKAKYDLSTLRWILHGAAPTPIHVKQELIDWLGPVVYEYYAATEGGGVFNTSEEWLKKPGTVGKPNAANPIKIFDDDGKEVAQGDVGTIYFKAPDTGRFEYFKDEEKTDNAYLDDHFTMGDMGYIDEDGYLFLTGRDAETIISGGVNIYPQETDSIIMQHPAVHEVCTIGIPSEEWGEEVRTVIQLVDGHEPTDALAEEIITFSRDRLPAYKCPRAIDFTDEDLPRLPTGKIQRRIVRDPYWAGRDKQI